MHSLQPYIFFLHSRYCLLANSCVSLFLFFRFIGVAFGGFSVGQSDLIQVDIRSSTEWRDSSGTTLFIFSTSKISPYSRFCDETTASPDDSFLLKKKGGKSLQPYSGTSAAQKSNAVSRHLILVMLNRTVHYKLVQSVRFLSQIAFSRQEKAKKEEERTSCKTGRTEPIQASEHNATLADTLIIPSAEILQRNPL